MMKRQNPDETIVNYIDVPSVDKYAAEFQKLGGKIISPKTAVPEMGYFAICLAGWIWTIFNHLPGLSRKIRHFVIPPFEKTIKKQKVVSVEDLV